MEARNHDESERQDDVTPHQPPARHRRRRCTPGRICCLICTTLTISPLIVIFLAVLILVIPLPDRNDFPTSYVPDNETDLFRPALGLYLGPSYVTAALAYSNNTVEPLGRVEADNAYINVLKRLQKQSAVHIRPPYSGMLLGPDLSERLRQFHRSTRKMLGLPSTSDVGILSAPLKELVKIAHDRLGYKPTDGLLVTLGVRALYDEDVFDIMTTLGLTQLPLRHYASSMGCEAPHELAAAYAGHGLGLCKTYWNTTACDAEEAEMEWGMVAGISYSEQAVAVSHARMRSADITETYNVLVDALGFDMGDKMRRSYWNESGYWDVLAARLGAYMPNNVAKVLLYDDTLDQSIPDGRTAGDELESIVRRLAGDVQVFRSDPAWVTAFGAARLALRGQFVGLDKGAVSSKPRTDLRRRMAPDPRACPWYAQDLN